LRDKGPAELRLVNLGLLTNTMGVAGWDAEAFLNNNAISPTTQTILVAALARLGNIPGQAEFIRGQRPARTNTMPSPVSRVSS